MPARRVSVHARRLAVAWLAALGLACAVSGCGGGDRVPPLSSLPIPPGTQVTLDHRSCNPGANAYCALELVVVGSGYRTSAQLENAETQLLDARKWTAVHAEIGQERAADSPHDRWRVTYATATGDLQGVELGWIKRARPLTVALSRTLFDHQSALSVLLQVGTT